MSSAYSGACWMSRSETRKPLRSMSQDGLRRRPLAHVDVAVGVDERQVPALAADRRRRQPVRELGDRLEREQRMLDEPWRDVHRPPRERLRERRGVDLDEAGRPDVPHDPPPICSCSRRVKPTAARAAGLRATAARDRAPHGAGRLGAMGRGDDSGRSSEPATSPRRSPASWSRCSTARALERSLPRCAPSSSTARSRSWSSTAARRRQPRDRRARRARPTRASGCSTTRRAARRTR